MKTRVAIIVAYLIPVVFFCVAVKPFYHRNAGFTALITFGDRFYSRSLAAVRAVPHTTFAASPGYDGQFYAQLAVEPLLRDRAIDRALDNPPYRARRILFSWTAYVAGLGDPARILQAYALQNILVWFALAVLLLRWFPPTRLRNVVPWAGCLLGAGELSSVRLALLDGPSLLVVALAITAMEKRRPWLAAGLMGAAGLGRETNLAGCGLLVDRLPRARREWLAAAGRLAVAALPWLLWLLYVRSIYADAPLSSPDNLDGLFAGYLTNWSMTLRDLQAGGWGSRAPYNIGVLVAVTVQTVYIAVRWEWKSAWWRMAVPYCALFAVMSYAVWGAAAARVLLPLAFAFNVSIAKLPARWFWPLAIAGNLSVPAGLFLMLQR